MTDLYLAILGFTTFGWLLAASIGIIRLVKNSLSSEERAIIFLITGASAWFGIAYVLYLFGLVGSLGASLLPGRPFLIAGIILILLYYRKHR